MPEEEVITEEQEGSNPGEEGALKVVEEEEDSETTDNLMTENHSEEEEETDSMMIPPITFLKDLSLTVETAWVEEEEGHLQLDLTWTVLTHSMSTQLKTSNQPLPTVMMMTSLLKNHALTTTSLLW